MMSDLTYSWSYVSGRSRLLRVLQQFVSPSLAYRLEDMARTMDPFANHAECGECCQPMNNPKKHVCEPVPRLRSVA
jgi:hypothetical protein